MNTLRASAGRLKFSMEQKDVSEFSIETSESVADKRYLSIDHQLKQDYSYFNGMLSTTKTKIFRILERAPRF